MRCTQSICPTPLLASPSPLFVSKYHSHLLTARPQSTVGSKQFLSGEERVRFDDVSGRHKLPEQLLMHVDLDKSSKMPPQHNSQPAEPSLWLPITLASTSLLVYTTHAFTHLTEI